MRLSTHAARDQSVFPFSRTVDRPHPFSRLHPSTTRTSPHRHRIFASQNTTSYDITYDKDAEPQGSDYYSILGLAPTATPRDIKIAYRNLMRDYHPDQSNDEDSHEFAIFLNHVYETLMDADSRVEYDTIAGFSFSAINPFMDTSYPAEYAFVDEFSCIGCRNCNNVCGKVFGMEEEFGRARVMRQGADAVDKVQEAIDTCPVSCIHWVSGPQLTLLEETMARMERVAAWILMNGGGKGANLNVFGEASIAWEKRQALRRDKEQQVKWAWYSSAGAAGFAGGAAAGSRSTNTSSYADDTSTSADGSTDAGEEGGGGAPPPRGRRVNVAEMAAAARKWGDYQRSKRQKNQKLLT